MAQQDDIIIIKTEKTITTSVLDYFLNIALVTEIETSDLVSQATFSTSGKETYVSLQAVAEKFATTSKIYKIARDIFNQKSNTGKNQSELKRLVIIKKEKSSDDSFEACLNRVNYNDSYFVICNPTSDTDIESVDKWVSGKRKLQFSQSNTATLLTDDEDSDIASTLKKKQSARTALYYHKNDDDESLAGAVCSILASNPVGRKNASYKRPSGITVDELSDTQEANLKNKNVNYYVYYIGSAGNYGTRALTSDNGVVSSGDEIQEVIAIDRIVLSLQSNLMDAIEEDIPFDDNGGTILYGKVVKVLSQLVRENILAEDSIDEETGEVDKSYTVYIPTRATLKKDYYEYFKQKTFIIEVTANLAGSAKKILLRFAY